MLGEMLDTTPAARRFYYAHLAQLTESQRLALAFSQSALVRQVAASSIRAEHPDADPEELRIRLAVRLYGRAIVERVLGPAPADAR